MNCDNIKNLSVDYQLGALDNDIKSNIDLHLETCSDCKDFYVFSNNALLEIENHKMTGTSNEFYEEVMTKIENENKRFYLPKYIRVSIAAAVVFIAIFSGSTFGNYGAESINKGFAESVSLELIDVDLADNDFDLFKNM